MSGRTQAIADALAKIGSDPSSQQAWNELIVVTRPYLLAHIVRRLRGQLELAEESLHDGYMALARVPQLALMPPHAAEAYVLRAAVNAAITRSRSELRRERRENLVAHAWEELTHGGQPEESVVARDLLVQLRTRLTPDEAQMLWYLMQGLSIAEIAILDSLTYSNCAVKIHRLRKKIGAVAEEIAK